MSKVFIPRAPALLKTLGGHEFIYLHSQSLPAFKDAAPKTD